MHATEFQYLTTTWHRTQVEFVIPARIVGLTIGVDGGAVGYISADDAYFAGPIADGVLTEYPSADAAKAHVLVLQDHERLHFPEHVFTEHIRLNHRSTATAYTIYDFSPHYIDRRDMNDITPHS